MDLACPAKRSRERLGFVFCTYDLVLTLTVRGKITLRVQTSHLKFEVVWFDLVADTGDPGPRDLAAG
ncbi:hypothetical protein [Arthrobacter polaris]|uniref:hypothetical protein n=1 Tax=Arthrobacter polaris TaxID=2813727 RepID=UPI001F3A6C1A|nr:hypothetical protein [Arthrobacter polaris]UIK89804.1 hypothetical protein J0916_05465 [Arthrobacter polaris]